jgi:integrase
MARQRYILTDKELKSLTKVGRHGDGGGLYLLIKPDGTRAWILLYRFGGKRREMGFGRAGDKPGEVKLAAARREADKARLQISAGIDPIEARRKAPPPETESTATEIDPTPKVTLGAFATSYIDMKRAQWRGRDTETSWRRTFTRYAAALAETPIAEIDTDQVLSILRPIWETHAETASKTRERVEEVLDAAKAAGHRTGDNPARWRGHLSHFLPKRKVLQRGHHPALPYERVPAFFEALAQRNGVSHRALEWTILTAGRESMTLQATWGEVDFERKVWAIPAERMKMDTDHRVPLSDAALAVLEKVKPPERHPTDLIFPGGKAGEPLSDAAMDKVVRELAPGYVPHGFRSTFRDWAGDETEFARELAEEALAHKVGDATERAYRRRDALEKRRKLMEAWGAFCAGGEVAEGPA